MTLPDRDRLSKLLQDDHLPFTALTRLLEASNAGIERISGVPLTFSESQIEIITGPGMLLRTSGGGIEELAPETSVDVYSTSTDTLAAAFGLRTVTESITTVYPLRFYRTSTPIDICIQNSPLSEVAAPHHTYDRIFARNLRSILAACMIASPEIVDHAAMNGLWYRFSGPDGVRETLALPAHHILRNVRNTNAFRMDRDFPKISGNSLVVIDSSAEHHTALRSGITKALESIQPALVSVVQSGVSTR